MFCDIDGTLWKHPGLACNQAKTDNCILLKNTEKAICHWERLGYHIILTTGRKESLRSITEQQLQKQGIVYDQLIMGLGGGDRILINDRKEDDVRNTAYAVNVTRDAGIQHYDFSSKLVTIPDQPHCAEEIIDYNNQYIIKKITKSSQSVTEQRRKTIYVTSGQITIMENRSNTTLHTGDFVTLEARTAHRILCTEDGSYLEILSI